ncbi:MAG: biotin synthase BioB [Nitrospirota bacterium]
MRDFIRAMEEKAILGIRIGYDEGVRLLQASGPDILDLISSANRVRHHYWGNTVHLCSIVNAKSGHCPENCNFCAQSAFHNTDIPTYPLMDAEGMQKAADEAAGFHAEAFGIVAAWRGLREGKDLEQVLERLRELSKGGKIRIDASLGIIEDPKIAVRLKEAGVAYYNHNLETARSFFPQVCTTHTYDDRVRTIEYCKSAGIKICCGGIFGMGENVDQRIEMAVALQELDVDVVPLNFLHPVAGTPFEKNPPLKPMEILKIIAVYRLMLPSKDIMTAGGRELHLRDLQSWMFTAGASHTLIGNYLTTTGRNPQDDLTMIDDLGLSYEYGCAERTEAKSELSLSVLSSS